MSASWRPFIKLRLFFRLATLLSLTLLVSPAWGAPITSLLQPSTPPNTTGFQFQWSTWTAFTVGEIREILYQNSSSTSIESELFWPVVPSVGLGASLDARWLPWLDSRVKVEAFIPATTGTMSDHDWNAYSSSGYFNALSQTTASLISHYRLEAEVGMPFVIDDWHLRPFVGLAYRQFYWEAWGPAIQTETLISTGQTSQTDINGLAITYRLQEVIPMLGAGVKKSFGPFDTNLDVALGIWPMYQDQDLHYLTSTTYQDSPAGGLWFRPSFGGGWNTDLGTLGLSVSYEMSRFSRGNIFAYAMNSGTPSAYASQSGSESDLWTIRVSWSSR